MTWPGRYSVHLGQPGPGTAIGGVLGPDQLAGAGPLGHLAEQLIPPDQFQLHGHYRVHVRPGRSSHGDMGGAVW
jgi:hypothetical protein